MTLDESPTRLIALLSLLVSFVVASPNVASGQNRERQQIMADVRMLHEQTMRLQQLISTLEESLKQIGLQFDNQASATVSAFADQRLLVDSLAGDVRILREKLDDTNIRISSMSQEVEALRIAIPQPVMTAIPITGEEPLPILETGRIADLSDESTFTPRLNTGLSPQRMYDTAWADYTNGQWELALEGFEAYLNTFPRSELADDAQFYVGQTHYADGNFQQSIVAFEEVLLNYPDGDVVAEAAYKRALALDRLGETERSMEAFEFVVRNYPDNTMAILAGQAIDRLNQP